MSPTRFHMGHQISTRAVRWVVGAMVIFLLTLPFMLSACSSEAEVDYSSSTSSVTPASEQASGTTEGAVGPEVGAAGPGGVGKVVATSDGSATYIDITADELAAMLENKDFLFINTHIPYEGEIEQTDLFLPYDEAAEQLGQLPADKDAKIVAYCRSDHMSRIAVEEWAKAGYTNLYNLDGGFVAWEQAGYELLHE